MDSGFWLGLALAVPIGLFTNLATPRVQKLLARRSDKARSAREKQIEQNKQIAIALAGSSVAYSGYLHRSLVKLLVYVVLILMVGGVPFYADSEGGYLFLRQVIFGRELQIFVPLISIILVTGFVIAFSTEVRNSRRLIQHVHDLSVSGLPSSDD